MAALLLAGVTTTTAGCGGVELEGKLFDALGVSPSATAASRKEPVVPERSGIVVPPRMDKLPAPGTGQPALADGSWPVDPELKRAAEKAEKERKMAAYCRDGDLNSGKVRDREWWEKLSGDTARCPTAFGRSIDKGLNGPK